jgi:uncharacterized protein YkwD
MKTVCLIFVFLIGIFFCGFASAESGDNGVTEVSSPVSSSLFSDAEIAACNTAAGVSYLSDEEKNVILYCNLARLDGSRFAKEYVKPYLKGKTSSAINSLYADLAKSKNIPALKPLEEFCSTAASHAEDMGNSGMTGHNSSDGRSMSDRLWGSYPKAGNIAENCSYGYSDALGIVIQLLVDEGLNPPGHRKNILNTKYKLIGVAIRPHKKWRYNCVQDFAG